MIYGERIQKNPCLSVEYIYNRKNNIFYTVISYGDKTTVDMHLCEIGDNERIEDRGFWGCFTVACC